MPSVEIAKVPLSQLSLAIPVVPLVLGADVVEDVVGVAVVDGGVVADSTLYRSSAHLRQRL